jgi:hypothetical protein
MRQTHLTLSVLLVLVAACGGDSKTTTADAPSNPPVDSSSTLDTPAGSTITVTGTATERTLTGMTAVDGATIAAYRNGDDVTPVAMTTSAADGTFSLSVPSDGGPLDGYLKATKAEIKDAYLYPPAPITADIVAPVNMIRQATWDTLVTVAIGAGNQQADKGLIALIVVSGLTADSTPVAGATVTSTPGSTVRYNMGIFPNGTTSTAADGLAFLLNVPSTDLVTVNATKGSTTYKSHSLKARAGQFTTTIVTP